MRNHRVDGEMKRIIFLLCCILPQLLQAQSLTQRLDALLNEDVLKTSEVGISVFDLTTGESLYRYQDEKLYRPASVEKIITSVTALAELGANYTFDTSLRYTGRIENDTLKGSLYIIGGMDPELMDEDLDRLVNAVEAAGIRYVTDTIAADVSLMDSVYWGPGWSWDDTPYSFQPYLSPLMLNRGCVDIEVTPTVKDSLPQVVCTPASDYYQVVNEGVSRNSQAGKLVITRDWLTNENTFRISGNVAQRTTETLNVYRSQDFFFQTFLSRLQAKGIETPVQAYAECPSVSDSLFTLKRPIAEVLKRALKESDNLCAEALFYHLGAKHVQSEGLSMEDGTEAVGAFMVKALGFNPERYRIADGSGVSLYNYVSPRLLLEYLKYAYYHRDIFLAFYDHLPIAGVDGTLKHRMKKTAAQGNVHAKTGSVTGVSSLAGYVKAANGHLLAFVIINQNVLKLSRARAFQNKVCEVLAN